MPLSSPSTLFNVFIPIIFATAATSYLYVGYQTTVSGHKSLQYMEPLSSISVTQTASPNGVYGPSVATSTVGQNVPNLKIVVNSPMDIGTNNGNSIGGAYSFFS